MHRGAISFREAESADAGALGALHVASWRETYAGILPDQLLNDLSAEARSAMWRAALAAPPTSTGIAVFVAESDGRMIGFGACGPQRDEALKARGFDGEFGAIYVLQPHQRKGVGRSLMRLMADKLLEQGVTSAALWVLRENVPAHVFYERLGGGLLCERADEEMGTELPEIAYGWGDFSRLIR